MAKKIRKTKTQHTIGIDLGGTKVAAALVDESGALLHEARFPTVPPWLKDSDPRRGSKPASSTDVKRHIQYVVDAMADAAVQALGTTPAHSIKGVGLASAGPLNILKGTLDYPANFLGWKIVPLVDLLQKALAKRGLRSPIRFQNDAMAAALGEGWVGRAADCETYIMITVGTGIGTGVILNGHPAQSHGMGSEWGHLIVRAPGIDSNRDSHYERSVEGLASGTGLIRRAKARGFSGESASDLAAAASQGDRLALELFKESAEALASLFYSLSLGFHPELFVVSGGMLAIKDLFLPQAIELYQDLIRKKNPKFLTPIKVSKLGNRAGVIGSARLPYL